MEEEHRLLGTWEAADWLDDTAAAVVVGRSQVRTDFGGWDTCRPPRDVRLWRWSNTVWRLSGRWYRWCENGIGSQRKRWGANCTLTTEPAALACLLRMCGTVFRDLLQRYRGTWGCWQDEREGADGSRSIKREAVCWREQERISTAVLLSCSIC